MKSIRIITGLMLFAFLSTGLLVTLANSQDNGQQSTQPVPAPATAMLEGKFIDLQAFLLAPSTKDADSSANHGDAKKASDAVDEALRSQVRTLGFETKERVYLVVGDTREILELVEKWTGKNETVEIRARVVEKKSLRALKVEDVQLQPGS